MRHDGVLEPYVKCFEIRKMNGRLHVWDVHEGRSVYTPPDFLRPYIRNRDQLTVLVARFSNEWATPIAAIVAFEIAIRPDFWPKSA